MIPRNIVTPAEALIKVRERRAPRVRPAAGMSGWIKWSLIDRHGRERAGGEQHNLILDTFLEYLPVWSTGAASTFEGLAFSHFAVGTGSTAPDVTNTALDAEVARFTTQISVSRTRTENGVYESVVERELGFASGNGNLTEWGIAPSASDDLIVRELFRDEVGDPVTVTKTSDFKLRIKYTFILTLTPTDLAAGSFVIDGIGTINGEYRWRGAGDSDQFDRRDFLQLVGGGTGQQVIGPAMGTSTLNGYSDAIPETGSVGVGTLKAYAAGSHERVMESATFSTAQGNMNPVRHIGTGQWAGVTWARRFGFSFFVDDVDQFEKDDLHILEFTDFVTFSWGRA